MTKVADFLAAKVHFSAPSLSCEWRRHSKTCRRRGEVLFPGGGEDDDVVQVEEASFPVEACQEAVHESGERSGSVAEAKRDLIEFK